MCSYVASLLSCSPLPHTRRSFSPAWSHSGWLILLSPCSVIQIWKVNNKLTSLRLYTGVTHSFGYRTYGYMPAGHILLPIRLENVPVHYTIPLRGRQHDRWALSFRTSCSEKNSKLKSSPSREFRILSQRSDNSLLMIRRRRMLKCLYKAAAMNMSFNAAIAIV